jgi:hypothetical protein
MLILFKLECTLVQVEMRNRVPPGWTYYGCWNDQDQRTLQEYNFADDSMTVDLCLEKCYDMGYRFAGVENGNQCWCDHNIRTENGASMSGTPPNKQCNMPCNGTFRKTPVHFRILTSLCVGGNGDPMQICGASWYVIPKLISLMWGLALTTL